MAADINHNYENLQESYLFAETAKRVNAYSHSHPEAKLIRMGL